MAEVALAKPRDLAPMNVQEVKGQIHLIQEIMQGVMKENEHYGTIPGTDKPTLLKSGAEKLCLTFRFDPEYEIIRDTEVPNYVSYTVRCTLYKVGIDYRMASGMGSCNSAEIRYRYRWEDTGKAVPKQYWQSKDASLLGADGIYRAKKGDRGWTVFKRVENDNPRDLANTILKMACKRALVAAVLNGTATSDIFTQDLEDMHSGKIEAEATIKNNGEQEKKKEESPENPSFLDRLAKAKAMLGREKFWQVIQGINDTCSIEEEIPKGQQVIVLNALGRAVKEEKKKAEEKNPTEAKMERKNTVDFLLKNLEFPFSPGKVATLLRLQGDYIEWLDPDSEVYDHRGDVLTDLYRRGLAKIVEGERGKRGVKYSLTAP